MTTIVSSSRAALAVFSFLFVSVSIMTGIAANAVAEEATLHAKDLTNVARPLLAKGPQAKKYLGRKLDADGKYRSGPAQGAAPAEVEFADFDVKGRIRGADEVHVLCAYSPDDPALGSLQNLVAHSAPVLNVRGTVTGADRSDSEGKIVAFIKLKDCMVTEKGL